MAPNVPVKVDPVENVPSVFGAFGFPLFRRLSREFDEMFGRMGLEGHFFAPTETMWTPVIEMFTKDNTLFVKAEIPGLKKEDVTVEITEDALVLKGERKKEKEEKGEGYYRAERTYGSFYRTLPLPEGVKIDTAKAFVHDGVLEVTMPIAKVDAKRRTLEIKETIPEKTTKAA
jgi:HSP20 family protein